MRLLFTTPEGAMRDLEVRSVSIPTPQGEMTVLPRHADLVSVVSAGPAKVATETGVEEFVVGAGVVEIRDGDVHLLADIGEAAESLDVGQIEAAVARAKQVMQETVRTDDVAFAAAAAVLERELARSRVARRRASRMGMRMEPTKGE